MPIARVLPISGAMPALATATSRPPSSSTVRATAASICSRSLTSAAIAIVRRPIRRAAASVSAASRSTSGDRCAADLHLARGLEADPPRRPGDQGDLSVEVVGRHRGVTVSAVRRLRCRWPDSASVETKQRFPELEERVLERWRETDVFRRSLENRSGAEVWSFYEGPPTANGRPGSHHVFSRVFKDVYPRYRTMRGYRVPRKAGWDCHGLPVELEVEKELGISSKQEIEAFGIAEFNARCRESVFAYVEDWNRLTERIGFWIDLDDPYVTLDAAYIESVWWSLRQIWDAGRLYEGHKVVPYCPRCGTALSSHEVALGYRDVEDPSVYVRLPVEAAGPLERGRRAAGLDDHPLDPDLQRGGRRQPGDDLCARPRCGDEVLVVAEALRERVLGEESRGARLLPRLQLAGVAYSPPFDYVTDFGPRGHTVLEADFVSAEEGTGLVHTAIAFGEDDFRLGEQYGLTMQNPVTLEGTFDERVGEFAGRFVKDADPEIVAALERSGRLFRGHHLRARLPALLALRDAAALLRQVELVRAHLGGPRGAARQQPRDRLAPRAHPRGPLRQVAGEQRRLGALPRPLLGHAAADLGVRRRGDCEERFCAGSVAELRERAIGEVPDDLHRPYIDEVRLRCRELRRRDGAGRLGDRHLVRQRRDALRPVPLPLRERRDLRGALPGRLHLRGDRPDARLVLHPAGRVDAALRHLQLPQLRLPRPDPRPRGQKMSKSRGNVVEPWDVISAHGADAFRWYYLTAQQPWSGYRFSVDTVGESVRQFLLTLWNTYSFWVLYANAEGLAPEDFPAPNLAAPGRPGRAGIPRDAQQRRRRAVIWTAGSSPGCSRTVATVIERMDEFDCTAAGRAIAELRRGSLQLVRAALAPPLLGGRPGGLRDPAPLPAGDGGAAGAVHPLPRR